MYLPGGLGALPASDDNWRESKEIGVKFAIPQPWTQSRGIDCSVIFPGHKSCSASQCSLGSFSPRCPVWAIFSLHVCSAWLNCHRRYLNMRALSLLQAGAALISQALQLPISTARTAKQFLRWKEWTETIRQERTQTDSTAVRLTGWKGKKKRKEEALFILALTSLL